MEGFGNEEDGDECETGPDEEDVKGPSPRRELVDESADCWPQDGPDERADRVEHHRGLDLAGYEEICYCPSSDAEKSTAREAVEEAAYQHSLYILCSGRRDDE